MKQKLSLTDLTQRAPRGFRVRLGGFVILPRMLDKGRATLIMKNGEYHYNCSMDQHLVKFLDFDPAGLLKELATGKGDGEILQWILKNSRTPRAPWEIDAWSSYMEKRGPDSDIETLDFYREYISKSSTTRDDLKTWFEVLELDDYVSFGGKA